MFKLPVCPYCGTIYRYGDVRKAAGKKYCVCYHCNKKFGVEKSKIPVLFLIIALFCAIFGVLELYMVPGISFVAAVVTNIAIILIGLLTVPYFIRFRKTESLKKTGINKAKPIDTKDYNKKIKNKNNKKRS